MEIISYVGFDSRRNRSPDIRGAISHFTALFGQSRKPRTAADFGFSGAADGSAAAARPAVPAFRMESVRNAARAAISIVGRNAASILSGCAAAAGVLLAAAGISAAARYIRDYTGPLAFQHEESTESAVLASIMAAFALEEGGTYASDGTLLGEGGEGTAAQSVQPFTQPVSYQTYRVQPGDTIIGITKKFGLTNISTLIAVNDIDNVRQLAAGQKLKIPSIDGLIYTVQAGNSLAGISAKFGTTLEDLLDVNELESADLTAGQQLFIPGARLPSEKLRQAMGELFKCPISAKYRISSHFGRRADPFTGAPSSHTGIDLACPQGTPILASASGQVVFVGYSNVFGNYIIINHGNGYQTLYGHMSKTIAQKNQWVSQGTRIGLVGSTGYSTGPHLHFTVYKNGKLVDPFSVLK